MFFASFVVVVVVVVGVGVGEKTLSDFMQVWVQHLICVSLILTWTL